MGTRALITILDEDREPICKIYLHLDGYPHGLLLEALKMLGDRELVNGYTDPQRQFNGMDDFAAQLVTALKLVIYNLEREIAKALNKEEIRTPILAGTVYIVKPSVTKVFQDFEYIFYPDGKKVKVKVIDVAHDLKIFDGTISEYIERFSKRG